MIRSFRSKALRRFTEKGDRAKLSVAHVRRLSAMLARLDGAADLQDMNIPGWALHPLKGEQQGRWAVSVSGNWRLTFGWADGDAVDVDLEDYH